MRRDGTCGFAVLAACALALAVSTAYVGPALAGEADEVDMIQLTGDQTLSIPRVIDIIGRDLDVNFILPDQLTGTVVMKWKRPLPKAEAFEILRAILDDEGYELIEGKYFISVVKKGPEVHQAPTDVKILRAGDPLGTGEKVVTAIIVLDYIDQKELGPILNRLLDPRSALILPLQQINAFIIKDAESRIRYVMGIVEKLDVPGTTGVVNIVRIEYADTGELARTINEILSITKGPSPMVHTEVGPGGVPVTSAGLAQQATGVKIIPDSRLNSLIIVASERETEQVMELIEKLDVPQPIGTEQVHTFQCKNQQARTLAEMLSKFSQFHVSGADASDRGRRKAELFFIADETTNKILVAASPLDWELYRELLEELDQPQPQVLVEVWIVEVSSEDQFSFGVEWQTRGPSFDARVGPSRQEIAGGTVLGLGVGDVMEGGGFARGFNLGVRSMSNTRVTIGGKTYLIPDIDAYLKALSEVSKVNVLSSPKVLTLNNAQANVDVTDQISISNSQISGTGEDREVTETFDRQDIGVELEFTPQINADGYVIMDIALKVSSLVGAELTDAGSRPVIAQRNTTNKVRVEDGQTIVISGLRRHDRSKAVVRVPLLGRIPIVGLLFRSTSTIDIQTNLMVFITPHIVTDTPEMLAITKEMQGQDIERERPRFVIESGQWRRMQRQRAREKEKGTSVWER